MRFVSVNGFCVRGDRQVDFQRWVTDNEERIRRSYPAGIEYGGIYAVTMSSERQAGDWMWLDILDSYGAMDRIAAAMKDRSGEFAKVNAEFLEFIDPDRSHGWCSMLLKSVVDASVWDFPTD